MISSAFHQIGTSRSNPSNSPTKSPPEEPLPSPPFISIPGVINFRSLPVGPSPLKSPITTTVFRSAQLNTITPAGATALAALGVRKVFDLRSSRERQKQLDREKVEASRPGSWGLGTAALERAGIEVVWTPVLAEQDGKIEPEVLERRWGDYTAPEEEVADGEGMRMGGQRYSPGFVRAYREILVEGAGAYKRIFEEIRDGDGSGAGSGATEGILVHCTAGKDRTGVFIALVLRLLGVEEGLVEEDYALTGIGLGGWREETIRVLTGEKDGELLGAGRGDASSANKEKEGGKAEEGEGGGHQTMTREQAERALAAESGTMKIWLRDVLEGEEGGVENYLEKRCGLSVEDIDKIKTRLLAAS